MIKKELNTVSRHNDDIDKEISENLDNILGNFIQKILTLGQYLSFLEI